MYFIDNYLNENSSMFHGDVQPALNESWITGENENELSIISGQFNREVFAIQENFLFAQGLAYVAEVQGKETDILSESFGGFFKSIGERIQKMWAKVKAFFVRLFKSISIALGDINKSLENVEKHLKGKDFSNFKYQGYNWNLGSGEDVAKKTAKNIESVINEAKTNIKIDLKNATSAAAGEYMEKDESSYTKASYEAVNYSLSYGEDMTLEQVKIDIKKKYGNYDAAKEIKGLKNWSVMVKFLREFNKNKTLTDLQKASNELYKTALTAIQDTQKQMDAIKTTPSGNENENETNPSISIANIRKNSAASISNLASVMGQYNAIMQFCIGEEKAIFSEYKSVIAKAVRYKG